MLSPNFFNQFFVFPILNLLVFFYKIFLFFGLPGAFGLSIIALTIVVRLLLHPFFQQQLEMSKKMQDLKPHLDRLSKKHKNDQKRLQQEQLKLYQQFGVNPASGCLFMIIQIPIFFALYNTLSLFLMNGNATKIIGEINKVLYSPLLKINFINPWFFGFNLALTPAKAQQWHYYLIPVVTAVLQYLQTSIMTPSAAKSAPLIDKNHIKNSKVSLKQDKDDSDDFQKAMNMQMKYLLPIMIGWFSYSLPVGLSLYWNIFSVFGIMQYKKLKTKS